MENINHRNFYLKHLKKEKTVEEIPATIEPEVIIEMPTENDEPEKKTYTEEYLKTLSKMEQIKILEELDVSKHQIKKLKTEHQRIKTIIDASGD